MGIGEFAGVTHLSIRTLRRYHDAGLLEPARVDPVTGYRSYSPEQVPTAQVIHQLRALDLPLDDVRAVLTSPDPAVRAARVAEHLDRLQAQLARTTAAVASLQRLLDPGPVEVELRSVPATTVAAVAAEVDLADVLVFYAGAMAELDAAVPAPAGPPGVLVDDALFTVGRGQLVVHVPADRAPTTGRVRPRDVPAADLAVRTHVGDHDTIDVTYGELGRWVAEHALAVDGPVRETHLVGPRDTPDTAAWRTEIARPVFRVSAG
jgi:DNA-binding transcriptional MerR regulator